MDKPFSMDYVVGLTLKHMQKSIDTSIRKTVARIAEFDGNTEKSQEVFNTLAMLHTIRKKLENL
jgi:hypothetical protein